MVPGLAAVPSTVCEPLTKNKLALVVPEAFPNWMVLPSRVKPPCTCTWPPRLCKSRVPASVTACLEAAKGRLKKAKSCLAPDDYIDAVVALDIYTGAIKWAKRLQGADTWTVSCVVPAPANPCPEAAGAGR